MLHTPTGDAPPFCLQQTWFLCFFGCQSHEAFPGVWGNKGTCPFIFREQGNICKYFKGTKLIWGNKEYGNFDNHF